MARLARWFRIILFGLAAIVGVILVAIASVVVYSVARGNQVIVLPAPSGPNPVGRTALDWVDRARDDPFASTPGAKRELLFWLWYPTNANAGLTPASYLPSALLTVREDSIWSALSQREGTIRAHALEDAPLAVTEIAYPVVIFEPGLGSAPPDYTVLAEDLASRGFVVVGIFPTFSTDVAFPDGRVIPSTLAAREPADDAGIAKLTILWSDDVIFAMNQLAALDADPASPFHGRLKLERLGVFGHSLGGAAALDACHRDLRCRATIDLDGTPFGDGPTTGLSQPVMLIMHDGYAADCTDCAQVGDKVNAIYQQPGAARYRLTVTGTRHFNFRDAALFYRPGAHMIGALGPIDPRRGLKVITDYVATFFNRHLNNASEPLLSGPSSAYPDVQFASHP
jgi:predicted dienelactone hydrolase